MKVNDKGYVDWEAYLKNPNPIDISYIDKEQVLPSKTISDTEAIEMADFLEQVSKHIDGIIVEKQIQHSFKCKLHSWFLYLLTSK